MESEEDLTTDWASNGWGIRVRTAEQLFKLITRIALLEQGRTYAWRGQNDAKWAITSTLQRELIRRGGRGSESELRAREREVISQARRWGLLRDLGASATDLHLLAVLQHHGVPTRLCDVTSNPYTALWFASVAHAPDGNGKVKNTDGVLFAFDVTGTEWAETFNHSSPSPFLSSSSPLTTPLESLLNRSEANNRPFRVFPAVPDDRMKAQEGFFLGSSVPVRKKRDGVYAFAPAGRAPGVEKLEKLLKKQQGVGRPESLPLCAIVFSEAVKKKIRGPLKRTYNRRPRTLFPDVPGFRDAFLRGQLD